MKTVSFSVEISDVTGNQDLKELVKDLGNRNWRAVNTIQEVLADSDIDLIQSLLLGKEDMTTSEADLYNRLLKRRFW